MEYSVKKVDGNAFRSCKNLKRIITPEGTESKFKEQILKTTNIVVVFN